MSHWQPSASLATLRRRAALLQAIRDFFAAREVIEVTTPLMCSHTVTDPFLVPFTTRYREIPDGEEKTYYLQTSPEYAMKRLLAAGMGSIYQICPAFRNEEVGREHNPEFTLLEWYRVDFTHHDLMHEIDDMLQKILRMPPAMHLSYRECFIEFCGIDIFLAKPHQLLAVCEKLGLSFSSALEANDADTLMQIIMQAAIEPKLGFDAPTFVVDYPKSQAALARLNADGKTAARFELYINGVEIANGYYECLDPIEQANRFAGDNQKRAQLGKPSVNVDTYLLEAMQQGLPKCAGVAMGLERLMMIAGEQKSLQQCMSFAIDRA